MHTFPIQIRFNDIDLLGHVNNVMYGHYFDMARYDFMVQQLGHFVDLRDGRFILIMVHTEYDFLQPSFMTDRLHAETSLLRMGLRSVHLQQRVVDDRGVVRVNSMSVMSTLDRETGKSFALSPEWKEALER